MLNFHVLKMIFLSNPESKETFKSFYADFVKSAESRSERIDGFIWA